MPSKVSNKNLTDSIISNCKFFYGGFHGHSSLSIGEGSPIDCYNYAYRNNLDFLILADHSSFFLNKEHKWNFGLEQCHKFNKKREGFTSFYGFEGKSEFLGDLNIINSKNYFIGNVSNPLVLMIWMLNNPNAFIIISNPLKTICLREYDFNLNKIISCVEVTSGNSERYLRREKYFFKLLDKGWKLGCVNGINETKLNFGDTENLTCIISPKGSKENLIQNIRSRHTYSTESKTLKLLFFINNTFMGGILDNFEELRFTIVIEDKNYAINKIEIISNEGVVVHQIQNIGLKKIKSIYNNIPNIKETWYVIKVYEETNKIALSSPIFLK